MTFKKTLDAKNIVAILATVLMIACFFIKPFEGLPAEGMRFLGVFIWWIVMLVVNIMPSHLSSLLAIVISIAVGSTTFAGMFSAFSGTTVWLLIGALGLAAGLGASGVLTRLALHVMKLFPGTYTGQLMAVTTASIILAPMLSSASAKSAILIPVVNQIGDQMGYEPHSKGITGLVSIVSIYADFLGHIFLTGSVTPLILISMCEGLTMGWGEWLAFTAVFGIVITVLLVVYHWFAFNPERGVKKEDRKKMDKEVIQARINELPKMNWKEGVALATLIIAVALWITESRHGIPGAVVAVGVWCVYMMMNLFTTADVATKIPWSLVLFVGGILGISGAVTSTGLGAWIGNMVAPVIVPLAKYPILVILIASIVSHVVMCGTVSYFVPAPLFIALLAGVNTIHPICIAFACACGSMTYFMEYQNFPMISSLALTSGRVVHKDLGRSPWWYMLFSLISLAVSVPYWTMLGYIG